MLKSKIVFLFCVAQLFFAGAFFTQEVFAETIAADDTAALVESPLTDKNASLNNSKDQGQLPLDDLRNFTQVFDQIRSAYVEEVDDKTLLKNAIVGMLTQLDPHSAYLDKDSFEDLQSSTNGEFGGLGIEIGMENGFVKVISPIDDTPAQRAGIKAGDVIIKIDNVPAKGMTLDDAVGKMRGIKGSSIVLTIFREGVDQPIDVKLVRDMIKVVSVRASTLENGFAYVRIAQFQVNTADDLKKALEKKQAEYKNDLNKDGLKGVVLDLRNNPGGVLQGSVDVVDLFLEKGLIVSTKGRVANSNLDYEATAGDMLNHAPLVVLINEGSASASEIVAGALQDHKRAIIMGTQSFGKGSVQTVIPLSDDQAIKLTTARYYTPSGRSIQAEGIVPDIVVEPAVFEAAQTDNNRIKEADLSGHLKNDITQKKLIDKNVSKKSQAVENNIDTAAEMVERLKQDNQLRDAFHLLKAVIINQQNTNQQVTPVDQPK